MEKLLLLNYLSYLCENVRVTRAGREAQAAATREMWHSYCSGAGKHFSHCLWINKSTRLGNQESIICECPEELPWVCSVLDSFNRMIHECVLSTPFLLPASNHLFICCTQCTCRSYLVPTNRVLIGYAACCPAPERTLPHYRPLPPSPMLPHSCLTSALQTILMMPRRFLAVSGCFFGCHKSYDFFNVISFILPATLLVPRLAPPSHTPRKLVRCWCW